MGNILRFYLEVQRLIDKENYGYKEACEKAKENLGIKKETALAANNKSFNNNITDIEKSFKYNIQDGQPYKEATGENIEIDPELIRDKLEEI